MTFSPDGRDLLVNLGGEQIYLYSVQHSTRPACLDVSQFERNGHSAHSNGLVQEGEALPKTFNPKGLWPLHKMIETRRDP